MKHPKLEDEAISMATNNKQPNHVYFFEYTDVKPKKPKNSNNSNKSEENIYATANAFYKFLNLGSLDKAAEVMDDLRQRFEKNNDPLTQNGFPVSLNYKDAMDNPLPTSPEFMVPGVANNHYVKGIRYDIFEMVYSEYEANKNNGEGKLASSIDASSFLYKLKLNGYHVSQTIQVAMAVLPIIDSLKRDKKDLQDSLKTLEQSIVVRKNESYLPKDRQITINDFGLTSNIKKPYIVDADEYKKFQQWMGQSNTSNGKTGQLGPSNQPASGKSGTGKNGKPGDKSDDSDDDSDNSDHGKDKD